MLGLRKCLCSNEWTYFLFILKRLSTAIKGSKSIKTNKKVPPNGETYSFCGTTGRTCDPLIVRYILPQNTDIT